ncbi:MAG TPA: hypothetical protein VK907_05035 [Phnomibacter sp.]|nr:hypothetical protein [Phnomibacter sp.]
MKKISPIITLLLICSFLVTLCSCGTAPEGPEPITPADPIDIALEDTSGIIPDTTSTTRNIGRADEDPSLLPPSASGPGEANVAYSFFRKIKKQETKDIRVLIKSRTDPEGVARQLRAIEERQRAELENDTDTNTIRTMSITGYENLIVSLVYDTADFEMTPVDTRELQRLDTLRGNYWHWRAKAITDKSESNILIIVKAENPGEGVEEKDVRQVPISIEIDHKNALRTTWNWIIHNPEYSVPSIFVPLVLFAFGVLRRKK